MGSIIVALPKLEDAKHISDILRRRGIETAAVCTSGSKVLSTLQHLDNGIVICGRRLSDMHYTQLAEDMPEYFEMLLITSKNAIVDCRQDVMTLGLPFFCVLPLSLITLKSEQSVSKIISIMRSGY